MRRELVNEMVTSYQSSERQACAAFGWARASHRYKSKADPQDILRMR